jgi:hypothetical protein
VVIALLLMATIPLEPIQECRCEVGERNDYYDCDGNPVFVQQIFWRDDVVADWRMTAKCGEPVWDWQRREWSNTWVENDVIYRMRYPVLKRSITIGLDPEVADREKCPKDERRGLR